ncbi:histidine phosphatase family protein [Piscinibacter sp. XHJ-5]|uniref:histidine phosphatase family protein n=1 Tax=Piscinibacter sp. XHJ-5 TaxID=3037797 RepID=UPI002452E9F9|nr:histidine phosphatase family protein [Piscinibacter sp. XHJ-5]
MALAPAPQIRAQDTAVIDNAPSSAPASTLRGADLVSALRRGGYVVYFRHTATDFSKNDSGMQDYGDCQNQRPLSEQGRRDAMEIGRQIRTLRLARGDVLASPLCRTMEHARLMLQDVTPRPEVRESQGGDHAGLKRLLASPVPQARNRWIVGHGNPFRAVAGPPHLAEGEAAVIEPGITRWTVVARIQVDDWRALAAATPN